MVSFLLNLYIHSTNTKLFKQDKDFDGAMAKKRGVIAQSLQNSIKEAGAVSVMEGAGTNFVSPYAIAMNANPFQVSLLTSLANLLPPWFQIYTNKLMKTRSRKFIIINAVLLQALLWLPLALIPFIFNSEFLRTWSVVVAFTLIAIIGGFAGPVWNSWMGDLVKEEKRGEYFSRRNKIAGSVVLISSLFAAWFLKLFNGGGKEFDGEFVLIGFSVLFLLALIFRLISMYYLQRQYEPRFKYDPESYFSIGAFVKRLKNSNLGNYVLYGSLLRFGTAIAGPFFAIYMLRELNWSYPQFISINIAGALGSILMLSVWGKISDKFGNAKLLIISGIMNSAIPLFWLVSDNWYYLLLVNVFAGAGWGGFNLSEANFIYDVVPRKKRSFAFTYNNIFSGTGVFLGATIGGLIATHIDIKLFGSVYLFLFLLSGILRFLSTFLFAFKLKEERKVEERPLWEIVGIEFPRGFIEEAFVFVDNALPRKEAIEEALKVNKMKLENGSQKLKKKILKFNRKFSNSKQKDFFTKI